MNFKMDCYICKKELIWGGDHDCEDEGHSIITNLSCNECGAFVLVYHGDDVEEPERYYEWMLWRLRKERANEKARSNHIGTTRNRKNNNSY